MNIPPNWSQVIVAIFALDLIYSSLEINDPTSIDDIYPTNIWKTWFMTIYWMYNARIMIL